MIDNQKEQIKSSLISNTDCEGELIESKSYDMFLDNIEYELIIKLMNSIIEFKLIQKNIINSCYYAEKYDLQNINKHLYTFFNNIKDVFHFYDKILKKNKVKLSKEKNKICLIFKGVINFDEEIETKLELKEIKLNKEEIFNTYFNEIYLIKNNEEFQLNNEIKNLKEKINELENKIIENEKKYENKIKEIKKQQDIKIDEMEKNIKLLLEDYNNNKKKSEKNINSKENKIEKNINLLLGEFNNNKKNIKKESQTKDEKIENNVLNEKHESSKKKFSEELLKKQLREINENADLGFSVSSIDENDIYKWSFIFQGPEYTIYEGGFFKGILTFPEDYPDNPPQMRMITEMFHPNIHKDGLVNMSILHSPGVDIFNEQESQEERWRPSLSAEKILLSLMILLTNPNCDAPANVDAAVMCRNNPKEYEKKVRQLVGESMDDD